MTSSRWRASAWLCLVTTGLCSCGSRKSTVEMRAIEEETRCPNGETQGRLLWQQTYAPDEAFGAARVHSVTVLGGDLLASGTMPSGGWVARLGDAHTATWQDTVGPAPAICFATPLAEGASFAACQVTRSCPLGSAASDCDTDVVHRYFDTADHLQWEVSLTAEGIAGRDTAANAVELPNGDILVGYNLSEPGGDESSRAHLRAYRRTGVTRWDRTLALGGQEPLSSVRHLALGNDPNSLFAIGEVPLAQVVIGLNTAGEVSWVQRREAHRHLVQIAALGAGSAVVASELQDVTMSSILELFDAQGNTLAESRFSSQRGNWATPGAVATTVDGRLFVGINDQDGDGLSEASVREVTRDGQTLWQTRLGATNSIVSGLSVRRGTCSLLLAGSQWEQSDAGAFVQVGVAASIGL